MQVYSIIRGYFTITEEESMKFIDLPLFQIDTARVEDSGMGKFSFFNPSKWNFIASFIF